MIRKILMTAGVLLLVVGITQIPFASWWVSVTPRLLSTVPLFIFGALGLMLSIIFVFSAASGAVRLRQFMLLLGLYFLLASVITLANQNLVRDLMDALLFNRARTFQMAIIWISAIIRIGFGAAILYAAAKPPVQVDTKDAEVS